MQLKKLLASSFQLLGVVLSFSLFVFRPVSASWAGPTFQPSYCDTSNNTSNPGCWLPINASLVNQAKTGAFTTLAPITAPWIFPTLKLGVGSVITGHALDTTTIDPTAVLDVNGQIRIRGGNTGGGSIAGKVLTGVEDGFGGNGLAEWNYLPPPISSFQPGYGIRFDTNTNTISVDDALIQKRIADPACPLNKAVSNITQTGTIACQSYVGPVNTAGTVPPSGLSGGGTGARTLSVNAGGGLIVADGGALQVNAPASGSGLKISSGVLQFDTAGCSGSNVYWKYDSVANWWSCGAPYFSPISTPGSSIMYLRRVSSSMPPLCSSLSPSSPPWTELGYSAEYATAGGLINNVRICGRGPALGNSKLCQVMYLTQASPTLPPLCSVLGTGTDWLNADMGTVYAADGPTYNLVRTCYKCN